MSNLPPTAPLLSSPPNPPVPGPLEAGTAVASSTGALGLVRARVLTEAQLQEMLDTMAERESAVAERERKVERARERRAAARERERVRDDEEEKEAVASRLLQQEQLHNHGHDQFDPFQSYSEP